MKKQKKEANVTKKNLVKLKRRQPNRSRIGDFIIYFFLILVALMMVFPLVFAINNALKPLDELFMFPPKVFAQNPTLDNFSDLFVTMERVGLHFPDSVQYGIYYGCRYSGTPDPGIHGCLRVGEV